VGKGNPRENSFRNRFPSFFSLTRRPRAGIDHEAATVAAIGDRLKISTQFSGGAKSPDLFSRKASGVGSVLPPPPPSSAPVSPELKERRRCQTSATYDLRSHDAVPSIWSMDGSASMLAIGCQSGRLEVWDAKLGNLMVIFDDASGVGVTHVRLVANSRLVASRISGWLEFFDLSADEHGRFHLKRAHCVRAHQQPLNCLEVGAGRVLTGSTDHTLKVFRADDFFNVFTLHGHCGPVTAAFIDASAAAGIGGGSAGSGSTDGMICLWDLLTGACLYSILAHEGPVLSLTHSPSYVISLGSDDKMCVWERLQGHLINSLPLSYNSRCPDLAMLTHNLVVTCAPDALVVWDARLSDPVKVVRVCGEDSSSNIPLRGRHQLLTNARHIGDTIVCSYGRQLRLVHFPLLSDKKD